MTAEEGEKERTVHRRVVRTSRVQRTVTVDLNAVRAMRLGVRLFVRGLSGVWHGRPVQLTLRTRPETSTRVSAAEDEPPSAGAGSQ